VSGIKGQMASVINNQSLQNNQDNYLGIDNSLVGIVAYIMICFGKYSVARYQEIVTNFSHKILIIANMLEMTKSASN